MDIPFDVILFEARLFDFRYKLNSIAYISHIPITELTQDFPNYQRHTLSLIHIFQ